MEILWGVYYSADEILVTIMTTCLPHLLLLGIRFMFPITKKLRRIFFAARAPCTMNSVRVYGNLSTEKLDLSRINT
jgi:hypothetical protein